MLFVESGYDYDYNYGWMKEHQNSGSKGTKPSSRVLVSDQNKAAQRDSGVRGRERGFTFAKPNKITESYNQIENVVEEEKGEESTHGEKEENKRLNGAHIGTKPKQENFELHTASTSGQQITPENKREDSLSSGKSSRQLNLSVKNKTHKHEDEEEIPKEIEHFASPAEKILEAAAKKRGVTTSPLKYQKITDRPPTHIFDRHRNGGWKPIPNVASYPVIIDENTVDKDLLERSKTLRFVALPSIENISKEGKTSLNATFLNIAYCR